MVDVTALIAALEEYRTALRTHTSRVADQHTRLSSQFRGLASSYDGEAARDFKARWRRTEDQLQEYADRVPALLEVLDERIDALRALDRGLG